MKLSEKLSKEINSRVAKYQEGGAMPQEAPMDPGMEGGAPEGGQDPMMEIIAAAQQAVEANDGQMALGVCAALLQILQQAQAGEQAPVFAKCGGKMVMKKTKKVSKKK